MNKKKAWNFNMHYDAFTLLVCTKFEMFMSWAPSHTVYHYILRN